MARGSLLGLPRFDWSLTLFGLCTFTFSIVTFYLDVAQLGIAVAVAGLFVQQDRVRVPFPIWLYAAFVLWAFLASFASPFPDIARGEVIERLKQLVIMLVAVNALRTAGQLKFYLLFFLGCFMLFPARGGIVGYVTGFNTLYGRMLWNYVYANPNDLAALTLLTFGIAVGLYLSEPSRNLARIGTAISAIILLVVILLTQSRGAFLGLVVAITPVLISLLVKQPRRFIGGGIVIALVVNLAVPASVWERLSGIQKLTSTSTIAEADPQGSAAERFEVQKVAWQIWRDNPVLGVGLGVYPMANATYAPALGKKDTHNTYLNLAAETGLPGLALWCAFAGSVLRYAYSRRRRTEVGGAAVQQLWIERGLVGFLVAGIFGSFAALTFPYLLLSVLWCSATLLASPSPRPASHIETKG